MRKYDPAPSLTLEHSQAAVFSSRSKNDGRRGAFDQGLSVIQEPHLAHLTSVKVVLKLGTLEQL